MSKETENLKREVDSLEIKVAVLTEKMDEIEQTEKIKKIISDQEGGLFKYLLKTLQVIAAIIFLLAAGNKAADNPEFIKQIEKSLTE